MTPTMIDSLKTFVGYQKVHLEGKKIVKDDPRLLLNCSAIAKGYSCDVIARLLEKEGVENYMVLIGGEVVVKGVNQNGVCWRTGINLPEDDPDGIKNNYDEIVQLCKKVRLPLPAITATFISKTVRNMPIRSIPVPVIQPNRAC